MAEQGGVGLAEEAVDVEELVDAGPAHFAPGVGGDFEGGGECGLGVGVLEDGDGLAGALEFAAVGLEFEGAEVGVVGGLAAVGPTGEDEAGSGGGEVLGEAFEDSGGEFVAAEAAVEVGVGLAVSGA